MRVDLFTFEDDGSGYTSDPRRVQYNEAISMEFSAMFIKFNQVSKVEGNLIELLENARPSGMLSMRDNLRNG